MDVALANRGFQPKGIGVIAVVEEDDLYVDWAFHRLTQIQQRQSNKDNAIWESSMSPCALCGKLLVLVYKQKGLFGIIETLKEIFEEVSWRIFAP
jgi:hypothetical protein